ncbi:uncharacterized protein si:ch211-14c7.2 isoform X1 [Scomber scombrus]|uniref:Uncharacterized protein si:ch211-14c7.2 isoform X1 n=1 Tax=Scomber scombrus TaxID=13677 RepID=A0AAV1NFK2_SCOSC
MLQQNNNNNYPCLNVSGSTREMLQKCSRASLPFPSRLELGLGDLPLIRGLRAWALCSKNRRKAGGLLGGGQAPTAPPAGRGNSTSCPRPADVYLSGEWGRMGYGLPLGLDARQTGIGALVTVATLKTSEGNGKTQTQCLFLRTEKGSCLYSTAKPGSGVTTSAASSVVGGWLRGKTGGGGGRDTLAGRRDSVPTPAAQTGANRVRVRSGRRWRKSGNAAGREKTDSSRERQQRSRQDPVGGITVEERQEERDKGGLDIKQFPSPQQDGKRARQEKEGACRSPRCCHNASPKTCTQCGRRAQRRESQEEHEEGENPRRGVPTRLNSEVKGVRKEQQNNAEEEEEKEGLCGGEYSNSVSTLPNPDLESKHFEPESHSGCDVEEKTQTTHSKASEKEEDINSEVVKIHTGNNDFYSEKPGEEIVDSVNGFSDHVGLDQDSEEEMESVDVKEEQGKQVVSNCFDVVSVSTSTAVSPTRTAEPSAPVEGSICNADHEACWVQGKQEDIKEHLEGYQQGEADPGVGGKDKLDVCNFEHRDHDENLCGNNAVNVKFNKSGKPLFFFKNKDNDIQLEEREASPPGLRHKDPSIVVETDSRIITDNNCSESQLNRAEQRGEPVWENRKDESEEDNKRDRVNPEEGDGDGEIWRRDKVDGKGDGDKEWYTEGKIDASAIQEDNCEEVKRDCALKDSCRLQESADGCRKKENGDTCGQTDGEINGETGANVTNAACADSCTSLALSVANPAPSLPPLGSMATGLPCLEAVEGRVGATAGDGVRGQEGKRRHGRELESQEEEKQKQGEGETVATEGGRKEEEEEEEEDEFGVFMQAEGEPAWSKGFAMSASVPCGSRDNVALGNHAIAGESTHWTPSWTDSSFHQSDDTWTAFSQDLSDEGRGDVEGQWWPTSTAEERKEKLSKNQNLVSLFAEAFPSLPDSSSSDPCDPCDLDTVPTLTKLLRGRASQDQGTVSVSFAQLLDSFHDLNKMIGQRYKRANGVSRDLLLKTLHLEQPHTERRPVPLTANCRLSPGLPSANKHAQNAAAKRRLSYDYNRNIME